MHFCNFRCWVFNQAGSRVFLIKPEPESDPLRFFFFFLNPYLTLFPIRPGKTRPIRVGPSRVPAGRAKIAIPNHI